MTAADSRVLGQLAGRTQSRRATTDDLQSLLLQVVLAIMMIFMIAYFVFVDNQKKERVEEVMALNRQKLELAIDKVSEDHRMRYGLNALMTQGIDGKRTFAPDDHVRNGKLMLAPAAKTAFAQGSRAASGDYADGAANRKAWGDAVFEAAGLKDEELDAETRDWMNKTIDTEIENVRLDARGVQRALAARLQKHWIAHPEKLADVQDVGELVDVIKRKSLDAIKVEIEAEVLP